MERRKINVTNLKVKRSKDGEPAKITGYAAVFNQWSDDLGGFIEQIDPVAFDNCLKQSDCRALINHESRLILGRESADTLKLTADEHGLYMEVIPPNTTYANDILESIERGDIKEQSFAFTVVSDKVEDLDQALVRVTILEIGELYDVGPVTYPAYPQTSVVAKRHNFIETGDTEKRIESARKKLLATATGRKKADATIRDMTRRFNFLTTFGG